MDSPIKKSNIITPKGASILFGIGNVTISENQVTIENPKYESYDIVITNEEDLPIPARQIIHEEGKKTIENYLTEHEQKFQDLLNYFDVNINVIDDDKMNKVNPTGSGIVSINRKASTTIGSDSVAIGYETTASNYYTTALGYGATATGQQGLALHGAASGLYSTAIRGTASGPYSTSIGATSKAQGNHSLAIQDGTAAGDYSYAEGQGTTASGSIQHVQGKYNIEDTTSAHIVGNGSSSTKSNAHTLDWDGNAWFQGDVYVNSTSGTNKDSGSVKLVKETDTIPIAHGGTGATTAANALVNLGLTATAKELNYADGVTSNIQTQLNNKMALVSVTASDAGKFLRVNSSGVWAAESIPNAEEASF